MSPSEQRKAAGIEEAQLDQAIRGADDLLVASLQQDERRRRRRRGIGITLIVGGLIVPTSLFVITLALNLAVPAGNLLQNGGIEEGAEAPNHWSQGADIDGVQYIWDKQAGKEGKASLCLHKTANRYFPIAQWYQIVDHDGGRAVRVSADVKAEQVTKAIIDVIFLDENDEWISHKWASYIGPKDAGQAPHTHDWKEYSGVVPVPNGTKKIQVALQIYGPGKVWFDNVRAEYTGSAGEGAAQ